MKSCSDFANSIWPFVMVAFISAVVTFVTWLTLSLTDFGRLEQVGVSALVFVSVGGTLLHYVIGCMRRHRRRPGSGARAAKSGRPPRAARQVGIAAARVVD